MFIRYILELCSKIKDFSCYLNYKIEPLSDKSSISAFDCGINSLNSIIHSNLDVLIGENYNTFVLKERWHEKKIIAVYSLANHLFDIDDDLKDDIRNGYSNISIETLKKQTNGINDIPSLEIALLAVEKRHHKKGIGTYLMNCIRRHAVKKNIEFLYVEAYHEYDYSAVGFYSKQGFEQKEFGVNVTKMFRTL